MTAPAAGMSLAAQATEEMMYGRAARAEARKLVDALVAEARAEGFKAGAQAALVAAIQAVGEAAENQPDIELRRGMFRARGVLHRLPDPQDQPVPEPYDNRSHVLHGGRRMLVVRVRRAPKKSGRFTPDHYLYDLARADAPYGVDVFSVPHRDLAPWAGPATTEEDAP